MSKGSKERPGHSILSIETEDTGGGVKLDLIELASPYQQDTGGHLIVVSWDSVSVYANRAHFEQAPNDPLEQWIRGAASRA